MFYQPPENSDDEEDDDLHTFGGRDGLIYVIDTHKDMFADESEDVPSKFRTCFECIEKSMLNTIINSEKDLTGIVFFNTKNNVKPENTGVTGESGSDLDLKIDVPKHISVFMTMQGASKESIQKIKSYREQSEFIDFETVYGCSDEPAQFGNVLWLCSKMFASSGYKLQTKTIVLFTCNDQPHPKNSDEFRKAFVRANDLKQQQIDMTIVPMKEGFNGDHFYQELICTVTNQDPETFVFPESKQSIDTYMTRIYRKDIRKKCIRHLKMALGDNAILGVSLYSMFRRTKYPKRVTLFRETNEVITGRRAYALGVYDEEIEQHTFSTDRKVLPSELRKFIENGGEKISFTTEEISLMKSLMEPGIRLLGFKPITNVSIHWYLNPVGFLFYDDDYIKGSSKLYRALWEKCLEKEKLAICVITLRRKTPPKYVALIPQKEQKSPNGTIIRHDGFRVFTIPCEVHIRNINPFQDKELRSPEIEEIEVFEKIVKKLRLKYQPENFENPTLRNLYSLIEAVAFDTERDDAIEDSTLPPVEQQDDVVEPFLETITNLFGEISVTVKKGAKRTADDSAGGARDSKLQKTAGELSQLGVDAILDSISNGNIKKFSVAQLKAYCQAQGISGYSKWTKDVLIQKITQHLGG